MIISRGAQIGHSVRPRRPDLVDMEVIVRRQNQEHSASITSMIRHYVDHYVARRAQVTEGHPHNAEMSVNSIRYVHAGFASWPVRTRMPGDRTSRRRCAAVNIEQYVIGRARVTSLRQARMSR